MRILLLVTCLGSSPALAQTDEPAPARSGVLVLPVRSASIPPEVLATFSELVVYSIGELGDLETVTPAELDAQVQDERVMDMLGCGDVVCAGEIGGALGTEFLLTASARKLGPRVMLALNLIHTRTQKTRRGQAIALNETESYPALVEVAVRDLFDLPPATTSAKHGTNGDPLTRVPEVRQPGTNLYWMRCPIGQTWDGRACLGEVLRFDWKIALTKTCPDGYRVPTTDEWLTLLRDCDESEWIGQYRRYCGNCRASASCPAMFGDDRRRYWSASFWHGGGAKGSMFIPSNLFRARDRNEHPVRCLRRGIGEGIE